MRITFTIPNKWGNALYQILKGIDSNDYIWKIGEEEEVLAHSAQTFFTQNYYDSKKFLQKIQETHYPIFVDVRLYKVGGNTDFKIFQYSDFLKSDCLLILFITDNEYVDIYCKEERFRQIIYNNAVESGFTDIELIDSSSNTRKHFSPYYD